MFDILGTFDILLRLMEISSQFCLILEKLSYYYLRFNDSPELIDSPFTFVSMIVLSLASSKNDCFGETIKLGCKDVLQSQKNTTVLLT